MATSEQVKDKLRVLCVMANALASICESAVTNADSDDAAGDAMVNATRRQFLTLKSIGADFLTVEGTKATRKLWSALFTYDASQTDALNAIDSSDFPTDGITRQKFDSICFDAGVSKITADDIWDNVAAYNG